MTNTPTPDQGEALTQAKTELTNLQSAYDAIRNLPPTEFTNHFARTIAEHQSHSRSNNDDGVPMLLVPLNVDTDTRAGIEVFAPDSDETEIDEELYCICSDCSPVLEPFFENIGVSISPRTDS